MVTFRPSAFAVRCIPCRGKDGILVAEVPCGVQHASSARTSPRRVVWPDPISRLVMLCPNFDLKAVAQGQSGDGIKLCFLSPEYIMFWGLVRTCWSFCLCSSPCLTQWQVRTKHNESLINNMAPSNKNLRDNDQDSDTVADNKHFCNTSNNWPRFLVVESSSDNLPLSKLSPFAVQKWFQAVAGPLKALKGWGMDRSWWNALGNHRWWVFSRLLDSLIDQYVFPSTKQCGIIRCCELSGVMEMEIKTELQEQGVVEVHRVRMKRDTEKVPTNTLFLTFNTPELLKEIMVSCLKLKVALFVLDLMGCFNCNKFGHMSQHCKVATKLSVVRKR